jgi:hypothetical protein
VGKPDGKSSLGRPSRRWEDILIWICKRGMGTDWIDLVQDRDTWLVFVTAVMNFRLFLKCGEFFDRLRTC